MQSEASKKKKNMAHLCSPVTDSTIIHEVNDEKFQEIHSCSEGIAQILNDGPTFQTTKCEAYQCVLRRNSHSPDCNK